MFRSAFSIRLVLAAILAVVALVLSAAALRVHGAITPDRRSSNPVDFEAVKMRIEPLRFAAVDGLELQGWLMRGRPGAAPLILCHDLGSSKESLINLAISLNEKGFPLFLFDFRGHGESEGKRSTLGIDEKRDVLGAVDYLGRLDEFRGAPMGVYGVGMGAHAAVLAAADRRSLRVLVLDGLYPDASYPLLKQVYSDWGVGIRRLGFLPETLFLLFNGRRLEDERAAEVLAALIGRDMLLLAPAGDSGLAREMQQMYETIPEQRNVDGNLILLPSTQSEGLYGADLERHHGYVTEFFETRLQRAAGAT